MGEEGVRMQMRGYLEIRGMGRRVRVCGLIYGRVRGWKAMRMREWREWGGVWRSEWG